MSGDQPIVIKKVKGGGDHGHHGGAWKVAYADFVTAMMAFFLLMWLINTTTPEQKRGIADYFAPASVSPATSGAGGLLGGTALGEDGSKSRGTNAVIEKVAPQPPEPAPSSKSEEAAAEGQSGQADAGEEREASSDARSAAMMRRESAMFQSAEMSLRQALQDMPELAELSKHVVVDQTPEGLRIQLIDQEGRPMFEPGSSELTERAETLMRSVGRIVEPLPNRLSISGHTDSAPPAPGVMSNWELSSARASAALRTLQDGGLPGERVYQIIGKAGSEPLFPDDPYMAGNRRVSIVLLREAPVVPPDHSL